METKLHETRKIYEAGQLYQAKLLYKASLDGNSDAFYALLVHGQLVLDKLSLTPVHLTAMKCYAWPAPWWFIAGNHLWAQQDGIISLSLNPKLATALDWQRRTPLHLASAMGNLDMVKKLVWIGGRDALHFEDEDGLTPLHLAAMNEHVEVVKTLIQEYPWAAKKIPYSILHMCVNNNCVESLKVLMKLWPEGALPKIKDESGNTLLHAAIINKRTRITNYLLRIPSIKAKGNAVNRLGLTALDVLDLFPRDHSKAREIMMEAGFLRAKDLKQTLDKPVMRSSHHKPKGFLSRTWARYVNDEDHWIEKQCGIQILVALVVAGVLFYSAGGTISNTKNGRYSHGNTVQTNVDMEKFNQFVAYNSITMITSLTIVLALIGGFSLRNKFCMWILMLGTWFTMMAMVATYWRSLSMMAPDGYVNGRSAWISLILTFGCGSITLIHTIFFLAWVMMKLSKYIMPK